MGAKIRLVILGTALLIFQGCALLGMNSRPSDAFPETVGDFQLGSVSERETKSYGSSKYSNRNYNEWNAVYTHDGKTIKYSFSEHPDPEMAAAELEASLNCFKDQVWKTSELKDKAGNAVGAVRICQKENVEAGAHTFGAFDYSVGIANSKRLLKISSDNRLDNEKLVEFIQSIASNPETDLSILDGLKDIKKMRIEELAKLSLPEKIVSEPYLKGKALVLKNREIVTSGYVPDTEKIARSVDEIGSLINIDCSKKGKTIGQFTDGRQMIPAISGGCEVTIIDFEKQVVIGQKTIWGNRLPGSALFATDHTGTVIDDEYIIHPTGQVGKYIKSLPVK